MRSPNQQTRRWAFLVSACILLATSGVGCQTPALSKAFHPWSDEAIPASRLVNHEFGVVKDNLRPIPQAMLGQTKPDVHRVGEGDVLSVFIYGVFPQGQDETPIIDQQQGLNQRYYPPNGNVVAPTAGLPVKVGAGGELDLPLIDPIVVNGMTTAEIVSALRNAYYSKNVLIQGQGRISVELLIPRTQRIVVMREDVSDSQLNLSPASSVVRSRRGTGTVVDLPIYENDVLHALAASGGLPGEDAANEVYVIRGNGGMADQFLETSYSLNDTVIGQSHHRGGDIVRIPLAVASLDCLNFEKADVILNDGDVVFIPKRREFFYTGGLLPGGRVPLPRDEDLDIIEAVAMVGASPAGAMGSDGGSMLAARQTYLRPAMRAVVLRKLNDGQQISIRVDLDRAMHDVKERLIIQPGDVVMLHQKPIAATLNTLISLGAR